MLGRGGTKGSDDTSPNKADVVLSKLLDGSGGGVPSYFADSCFIVSLLLLFKISAAFSNA